MFLGILLLGMWILLPGQVVDGAPAQWQQPREEGAWVEVVPFASRGDAAFLRLSAAATSLTLPKVPQGAALVCMGGDAWAIDCRPVDLSTAAEVEPWLGLGAFVTGQIFLGREPLAGADVAVVGDGFRLRRSYVLPLGFEDGDEPSRWVETDRQGTFELPQLAPGDYRLEVVRPGGKRELTEPFTVPPRESLLPPAQRPRDAAASSVESDRGDRGDRSDREGGHGRGEARRAVLDLGQVVLEAGLRVQVSVLSTFGEPIEAAQVGGIQTDGPAGAPTSYSASSDAEGRAAIEGAAPGVEIQMSCRAPGFAVYREIFPSPPTDVVCVLERLGSASGIVLSQGEPLAGATVTLPSRKVTSDEEGRFELVELKAGGYRLVAAAPGMRVEELSFEVAQGEDLDLPPVELRAAPEIRGVVLDSSTGLPVPGTSITSLEPEGAVATVTDAEGRFVFATETSAAGTPLRLQLEAAGFPRAVAELSPETLSQALAADEELQLEVSPGGRLAVTVYDRETGEPCLGCDVSYYVAGRNDPASQGGLYTGPQGTARSDLLPVGTYQVHLAEVTTHGTTVSVRSGHNVRKATVEPQGVARVVFGERRDFLRVRLWPVPPPGWKVFADDGAGAHIYPLDAGGRFELRRVSGREIRLRLGSGGMSTTLATIPASFEETHLDLEIPRTSVRGRLVTEDGTAATGPVRARGFQDAAVGAWTLTRGDGSFEMPHLPPGSYWLLQGERQIAVFTLGGSEDLDLGVLKTEG